MLGAKALLEGKSGDLTGFHIHSANEFTIELERPVSFFPVLISFVGAGIVPEGTARFGHSWNDGTVGTGPFRVASFEPGRRLELERNPLYWREGFPRSEKLVFSLGVTPEEIVSGFRSGRYSLAADLFPADVEALRRDAAFAAGYRETPRLSTYYAAFNIHRGPLSERELRRRIVQGVDVAGLVRQTLGQLAIPARGLIPPGLLGYQAAQASRPRKVEKPGSGRVQLSAAVHPVYTTEYAALFDRICGAFGEAGFEIRQATRTMQEFLEAQKSATVDLVLGRWIADYPDSDTFVSVMQSQEGNIGALCGIPAIDPLIDQGRTDSDPRSRHLIYRQVEEIIAREALLLPFLHEQVYRIARPDVEGLSLSYWCPTVAYENLRVRSR
jgi:peptide/nickel transport system substrate-binding protein